MSKCRTRKFHRKVWDDEIRILVEPSPTPVIIVVKRDPDQAYRSNVVVTGATAVKIGDRFEVAEQLTP